MLITTAQVTNEFTEPVPVSPLGADTIYAVRTGLLAAGAQSTLVEVSKPAVIEVLEVCGSAANAPRVRIYRRKPDNSFENLTLQINANGSQVAGTVPSIVNSQGSSIFDIITYDAATSSYKMGLNRPLAFPNGFRVVLDNQASTEQNVAGSIFGRVLQ